jgi:chitinase
VEAPKSAIIVLFTALVGLRGGAEFAEAARIRRWMSSKEVSALGKSFKDKSDLLHSIQKTCKTWGSPC